MFASFKDLIGTRHSYNGVPSPPYFFSRVIVLAIYEPEGS